MTQNERWQGRYNEVKTFIETHHRNPSKYVPEEKLMVRKRPNLGPGLIWLR